MKKITLLLVALICFASSWANQYELLLPSNYADAIVSPAAGTYNYLSSTGESITIGYRFNSYNYYTAQQFKEKLIEQIASQNMSSRLSVSSVTWDQNARTGTITLYVSVNNTGTTFGLNIKAGSVRVSYYQSAATFTLYPYRVKVLPGQIFEMYIVGSIAGATYDLYRNNEFIERKIGTGSRLSFTQTAQLYTSSAAIYTIQAASSVNGTCEVSDHNIVTNKTIKASESVYFVDQLGGRVKIKSTWTTTSSGNELGDMWELMRGLNDGQTSVWNNELCNISYSDYDNDYCDLSFDFEPNDTYEPKTYRSIFLFDDEGTEVRFEQAGKSVVLDQSNWVRTKTFIENGGSRWVTDITYHDGLGRPEQTVSQHASPLGDDLITLKEYDSYGREFRQWLPVVAGRDGICRPDADIKQMAQNSYSDLAPYTQTDYESSPLNRPSQTWNSGQVMHDNSARTSLMHGTSQPCEVLTAHVGDDDLLDVIVPESGSGVYCKQTTTDADGRTIQTFTDHNDKLVLSRAISGDQNHDTYYFYDLQGRLRWVVSPEGSRHLFSGNSYSEDAEFVKQFGYVYHYDARSRIVSKRFPGRETEELVYNHADMVVAKQDGNLRTQGKWIVCEYDGLNRIKWEGVVHDPTLTRDDIQALFATYGSLETVYSYSYFTLMRQCWYDLYPSLANGTLSFSSVDTDWDTHDTRTRGLITHERLAVVGDASNRYVTRTYYYDRKGRLIQTRERNHLGGISQYACKYDFRGNVLTKYESHSKEDSEGVDGTSKIVYTYDDRGRKLSEAVNDNEAKVIYDYDQFGRRSITSYIAGSTSLKDTLTYNIQGWMASRSNPHFRLNYRYYNPIYDSTARSFTGNIAEYVWKTQIQEAPSTHSYRYDSLNRLIENSDYRDGELVNANVERGISYDRNGNIKTLARVVGSQSQFDYSYHYHGNRLVALVNDADSLSYSYDVNGNMTHDGYHGLDIAYNSLNLIESVRLSDTDSIKYLYLCDGTKLSAVNSVGAGLDYLGSLVYRRTGSDLALESIAFSEGRIQVSKGSSGAIHNTHFHLTDHLGSVRAIDAMTNSMEEYNDYLPFGSACNDGSTPQIATNRYRYNGKEEQAFLGLPYIDYGARQYDPTTGRWFGMDPLAEIALSTSPYAFCGNNPIVRIDRNGEIWETVWDLGNLIYDVGAAIIDHVSGDHTSAKGHWKDAGWDFGATVVPFVPAGISKGVKIADKAIDATKAADRMSAAKRGVESEKRVLKDMGLKKNTKAFSSKNQGGKKTIPDAVDAKTIYEIKDVKTLSNTKQIKQQRAVAKKEGKQYQIITGDRTHVTKKIKPEEVFRRDDLGPQYKK